MLRLILSGKSMLLSCKAGSIGSLIYTVLPPNGKSFPYDIRVDITTRSVMEIIIIFHRIETVKDIIHIEDGIQGVSKFHKILFSYFFIF